MMSASRAPPVVAPRAAADVLGGAVGVATAAAGGVLVAAGVAGGVGRPLGATAGAGVAATIARGGDGGRVCDAGGVREHAKPMMASDPVNTAHGRIAGRALRRRVRFFRGTSQTFAPPV